MSAFNAPFLILINAGSGSQDAEDARTAIDDVFAQAGRKAGRDYRVVVVEDAQRLQDIIRHTVAEAQACGGAVVVCGGDGTISAVANALIGSACAMGVLPHGTFNYFGRAHGIPEDLREATRALLRSQVQPVRVGLINGRVFLVNASLGLYPQLLEDREAFKQRYGRSRIVAFWSGLATLLRQHRQLRLTLERHGKPSQLRTLTLFVGNNPLQMEQLGIPLNEAPEQAHLGAVVLRPVGRLAMLGLVLRGAIGRLGDAENVHSFEFQRLTVKPSSLYGVRRVKVATDGEILWLPTPLEFRVSPQPLYLLKPTTEVEAEDVSTAATAGAPVAVNIINASVDPKGSGVA